MEYYHGRITPYEYSDGSFFPPSGYSYQNVLSAVLVSSPKRFGSRVGLLTRSGRPDKQNSSQTSKPASQASKRRLLLPLVEGAQVCTQFIELVCGLLANWLHPIGGVTDQIDSG